MTFGERLVHARNMRGLSQKAFAEFLEITPTRLNYWEKDKREPDLFMIDRIAGALQISVDWLICETGSVQNSMRTTPESVGAQLCSARQAANITQEQLAEILDVPESTITAWEDGENRPAENRFAQRLRMLRKGTGITIQQLGDAIGFAKSTVAMWEVGKREPNIQTLIALAQYFNCTLDYLIGLSDE